MLLLVHGGLLNHSVWHSLQGSLWACEPVTIWHVQEQHKQQREGSNDNQEQVPVDAPNLQKPSKDEAQQAAAAAASNGGPELAAAAKEKYKSTQVPEPLVPLAGQEPVAANNCDNEPQAGKQDGLMEVHKGAVLVDLKSLKEDLERKSELLQVRCNPVSSSTYGKYANSPGWPCAAPYSASSCQLGKFTTSLCCTPNGSSSERMHFRQLHS